jgi:hypothetical protein
MADDPSVHQFAATDRYAGSRPYETTWSASPSTR